MEKRICETDEFLVCPSTIVSGVGIGSVLRRLTSYRKRLKHAIDFVISGGTNINSTHVWILLQTALLVANNKFIALVTYAKIYSNGR